MIITVHFEPLLVVLWYKSYTVKQITQILVCNEYQRNEWDAKAQDVSEYYQEVWDVFANQSENSDSFATHSLLSLTDTKAVVK